jgi:DNA-binding MarR family transcriptional regulator
MLSNEDREALLHAVSRAVTELQNATDAVDEAAAARLGVNRTDLRCMGILFTRTPITAGELAAASGLTPGAFTIALDRLERAGYARRVRDAADRRRVLVELTPKAHRAIQEIWDPIGQEGQAELATYTTNELRLLHDFLQRGVDLQLRHAARIRKPLATSRQPAQASPPRPTSR